MVGPCGCPSAATAGEAFYRLATRSAPRCAQTLGALDDDDLAALARATNVVEQLVRSLQTEAGRA